MNDYLDKLRSISTPRRRGSSRTLVEREGSAIIRKTEHWDDRVDVAVTPDVVRYGTEQHNTGKRRGEVAEVRELSAGERRERGYDH